MLDVWLVERMQQEDTNIWEQLDVMPMSDKTRENKLR